MKGRTVEKILFFASDEERSISIIFQDKMALNLSLVPEFRIEASFENYKEDQARVVKRWKGLSS